MRLVVLSISTRACHLRRERACLIAMITLPLSRVRTGMHSVQPVAMSVSTIVCTKLPDEDVPECATKSTSTKPGGGSFQSPKVRTGTDRRTAELIPARRRWPQRATMRTSVKSRSIVAGLTVSSLPRGASSRANRPCRSSAGNKTGINGLRRLEHSRSEASHNTISASRTSLPNSGCGSCPQAASAHDGS